MTLRHARGEQGYLSTGQKYLPIDVRLGKSRGRPRIHGTRAGVLGRHPPSSLPPRGPPREGPVMMQLVFCTSESQLSRTETI